LFYDKETATPISVDTEIGVCQIKHNYRFDNYVFWAAPKGVIINNAEGKRDLKDFLSNWYQDNKNSPQVFNSFVSPLYCSVRDTGEKMDQLHVSWNSPVKKYDFLKGVKLTSRFHFFLSPPEGQNLFAIVNTNKKLFKEISSFFKEYKLDFVMDTKLSKFALQKKVDGVIYTYDYNLIADTLQRYIFNLMAIESNKESVLLFEEPEAHMFPPYTQNFAKKVIDSKFNQFFITTHSPFILNTIIENTSLDEVAVFVAGYEKFQTKLKPLGKEELEDMLNYGNDIFFSPKLNG
jgi:AAA15 family ATPase/GTPase